MRYNILLILSAICLLASCSVEEDGKDRFDVSYEGYTLFDADFEAIDMAGEESDFIWNKEVAIGVFGSQTGVNEKYTLKNAFDGKAAGEFYGKLVSGNIMAYYPYSEEFTLYDGDLTYRLSQHQSYNPDDTLLEHFCRYAGYAYAFNDNDAKLNFRYASGLLSVKVDLSETVIITSIELVSKETAIAGVGKVEQDMSVSFDNAGTSSIRADFGEGLMSDSVEYPIVMPAGSYDDLSLVLKVKGMDDMVCVLGELEIERISSDDYTVTELVVKTGALGGFEIEGGLEFEQ